MGLDRFEVLICAGAYLIGLALITRWCLADHSDRSVCRSADAGAAGAKSADRSRRDDPVFDEDAA